MPSLKELSFIPEPANWSYSRTVGIESEFNLQWSRLWFHRYENMSFLIAIYYLIFIVWLKVLMKNREPFKLRKTLFLWNLCLCIFSGIGALRTMPEMIEILKEPSGLHTSICLRRYYSTSSSFWALMFVWSKAFAVIDSVFIALRKKPLNFLHWYHHSSVLVFCWKFYAEYPSTQRWFTLMNYTVHTVMYAYFALRALKIHIPRRFSILITRLQMTQMMFGLYVILYSYHMKRIGGLCLVSDLCLTISFSMYFTYFMLFAKFFLNSYTKSNSKQRGPVSLNCLKFD